MKYKVYYDILSTSEKSILLNVVKTKVYDRGKDFPGLQSDADLHFNVATHPLLIKLEKYMPKNSTILKCWANYTTGDFKSWHTHPGTFSIVYMLQNKSKLGTVLKDEKEEIQTICPENSCVIFDNSITHSSPSADYNLDRYTLAMDFE
jgi:hypothetical protein